ncbi:MAG: hypothetical protein H7Y12_09895 [Sphingobacteriaceae bacterium]|nr:hypothetical protein [Cytophagaceae bacterium]
MPTPHKHQATAPAPDEELADETYTPAAREDADVPDLQPLLNDYTDQDEEENGKKAPKPDHS